MTSILVRADVFGTWQTTGNPWDVAKETPNFVEWMRDRKFLMELHSYPV
jgi:hypothetical protein